MTHGRAVVMMLACTLMWSIAGVVARQLESARSFEVTFWRSAFTVLSLVILLGAMRGPAPLVKAIREGGKSLWTSGVCWAVMFTAFMIAVTLTTVANVLVTLALGPLFTALVSRFVLGHRLATRTWGAIAVAGLGIAWMYGREVSGAESRHLLGVLIALCVPVAAAVNWTLMQHLHHHDNHHRDHHDDQRAAGAPDMLPAVLIGAMLSSLVTLPLALPFASSGPDLLWLALLGLVQLAIPCLMAVAASRVLSAPEVSLLALLEVIFGVAWAWWGGGETPSSSVLVGGAMVLGALATNEWLGMRQRATLP